MQLLLEMRLVLSQRNPKQSWLKTEVRTLTVNFKGGETIGAMGGGIAVATRQR